MTGATGPVASNRPGRLLLAVFGATFFVRFAFGITVAVFASYIIGRSQGIDAGSVGVVGLVGSLAPVGEFSTVLLSGAAADRYGRFRVLFAGMAGAALLFAAVSVTRSVWALGALNLVFGVSSGAILAASLAIVADHAEESQMGYAMGRFDAVNLLGWILGFAFGFGTLGVLANGDLAWVFRLGAVFLVAGFLFAWFVVVSVEGLRESRQAGAFRLSRILAAITRRDVLLVTIPWLVIYMLIGTGFIFLGTAATGAGISATDLALLIGGGGLLLLATQPYFGRLSDRVGRIRMMLVGTVGFVGVLTCAGLLASYGPRPVLLGAVGVSILAALAYGPAALAALADLSESISRATTMALYTLVLSLGMIVGLLVSTTLFSDFGAIGLDVFFAVVGAGLVMLTAIRYRDVRAGRTGSQFEPPLRSPTIPVR